MDDTVGKPEAKIIYFPMKYIPSFEQITIFKTLQAEMLYCSIGIYRDSKDRYEEVLRIQQLANKIRKQWEIIDGGLT